MPDISVFILFGPEGTSLAEQWVAGGRRAALADAVQCATQAALSLSLEAQIVIATSETYLANEHPNWPVQWDFDISSLPFHFGERLAGLLRAYAAPVHVYLGAASIPLLPVTALAQAIAEVAQAKHPYALTNNLYSSDWIVLNCPEAVQQLPHRLEKDNSLGWVLKTEAGVEVRGLPANAATRCDVDTPADLLGLSLHPGLAPNLRAYLQSSPHDASRWQQAERVLHTPGRQVALIGRVSSAVWSYVESRTQVWIRVFSEERGMVASGRQAAGQVRSLVAAHLAQLGPEAFFADLSEMADAVFFDTRVVLAHQRAWPSAADRYASDLGVVQDIHDASLRQLTEAALRAPMPVVLGGHGVVAGGLYALLEAGEKKGLV